MEGKPSFFAAALEVLPFLAVLLFQTILQLLLNPVLQQMILADVVPALRVEFQPDMPSGSQVVTIPVQFSFQTKQPVLLVPCRAEPEFPVEVPGFP